MTRRLLLIISLVLALAVPVGAQTFTAQIQQFWNQLRVGTIAFATGRVQTSGYLNFGNTVGTNGYGFRDNAGTLQFKDSGGAWSNFPTGGLAPAAATYLVQVANASLPNAQAIGALSTGVLLGTTTTGVLSSLGVGTVAQALIGGTTPAFGNAISVNGIALTATDGWILQNTTAATGAVTVQVSPRTKFCGTAWNSVGTASETDCFAIDVLPATVAGATTNTLRFSSSIAGGAYSALFTMNSAGSLTLTHKIGVTDNTGEIFTGNGGFFYWLNRAVFTSPADSKVTVSNNATTVGFTLDASTADTLKLQNFAANAYGTMDALAYKASGTAITSGTTFLTSGSGMNVANVGANSCGTSAASIAGNNTVSVTTVGATAGTQCRIAFTFAATTEWDCAANDDTTTVAVRTTPVDTTHTDIIGTFTAGDKVTAVCFPR